MTTTPHQDPTSTVPLDTELVLQDLPPSFLTIHILDPSAKIVLRNQISPFKRFVHSIDTNLPTISRHLVQYSPHPAASSFKLIPLFLFFCLFLINVNYVHIFIFIFCPYFNSKLFRFLLINLKRKRIILESSKCSH